MVSAAQFCERLGLTSRRGATEAELSAFEEKTGLSLPPDVREFYQFSNGLNVGPARFKILSLDGALPIALVFRDEPVFEQHIGLFPFTDFNDSNTHCIACQPPLRGRVIRVFHDDSPVLQFRSFHSFLDAVWARIAKLGRDDDAYGQLDGLHGVYDGTEERTPEDVAAGQALLHIGRGLPLNGPSRCILLSFAMSLLPAEQVDEIAALLYDEHYVREAAVERLRRLGGLRAAAALGRVAEEMTRFGEQAAVALRQAGLTVASVSPRAIRLEPGPVYLNMHFLFDERARSDALAFIVERAKYFLSQKPGR